MLKESHKRILREAELKDLKSTILPMGSALVKSTILPMGSALVSTPSTSTLPCRQVTGVPTLASQSLSLSPAIRVSELGLDGKSFAKSIGRPKGQLG